MQSWEHEIGDVLWINHNGAEVVARVAGYFDSLDNTKPLYVNLRVSDGLRWGSRNVKIQPAQIVRADPEWGSRRHAEWEASIKAVTDGMSPTRKQQLHEWAEKRRRRSSLEIAIDHACGLD